MRDRSAKGGSENKRGEKAEEAGEESRRHEVRVAPS